MILIIRPEGNIIMDKDVKELKKNKTQTFMASVALVMFSQILIKILGLMYRVVITNIDGFGDAGNGIYNYGYQIYVLLLAISSVGIPNAIAKLVSEKCATDDFKSAYRIFKCALVLFAVIGGALSCMLYILAPVIDSKMFDTPTIVGVLRVLSPAIFFVSVSSVIRGFFQGMKNMKATSTSQVIEQLIKCVSTILIVLALAGNEPAVMAAGATVATTLSTFLSLLYLAAFYGKNKKDIKERLKSSETVAGKETFGKIAKGILYVAIPISLGSIVSSINRVVDLTTVVQGLKVALEGTPNLDTVTMTLSGMLSKGDVIINLPLALNIAFSTVLVPTVAGALAVGDKKTACDKVSFSLLVSIIIALPATVGCMVLSDEIFMLIYPNAPEGGDLFAISAITIFFSAITQTNSGSLQGIGKVFVPATALLAGGCVKLITNLVLVPMPEVNIYGAPIGSVLCQAIACIITFAVVRKNLPMKLDKVKYFVKPFTASAIMGAAVFSVSRGTAPYVGNKISTIAAIGVGLVLYAVLILKVLKVFDKEEILQIPGGSKLVKFIK